MSTRDDLKELQLAYGTSGTFYDRFNDSYICLSCGDKRVSSAGCECRQRAYINLRTGVVGDIIHRATVLKTGDDYRLRCGEPSLLYVCTDRNARPCIAEGCDCMFQWWASYSRFAQRLRTRKHRQLTTGNNLVPVLVSPSELQRIYSKEEPRKMGCVGLKVHEEVGLERPKKITESFPNHYIDPYIEHRAAHGWREEDREVFNIYQPRDGQRLRVAAIVGEVLPESFWCPDDEGAL